MSLREDIKCITEKATGWKRPDNPQDLLRERKPQTYRFKDDGLIPNHSKWPLVIYKNAVRLPEELDPAAVFEDLFETNGWGDSWRDGTCWVPLDVEVHEVRAERVKIDLLGPDVAGLGTTTVASMTPRARHSVAHSPDRGAPQRFDSRPNVQPLLAVQAALPSPAFVCARDHGGERFKPPAQVREPDPPYPGSRSRRSRRNLPRQARRLSFRLKSRTGRSK
jgi:hypothetical protein